MQGSILDLVAAAALAGLIGSFVAAALDLSDVRHLFDKVPSRFKPYLFLAICLAAPFALAGLACLGVVVSAYAVACPDGITVLYVVQNLVTGAAAFVIGGWYHQSVSGPQSRKIEYNEQARQMDTPYGNFEVGPSAASNPEPFEVSKNATEDDESHTAASG